VETPLPDLGDLEKQAVIGIIPARWDKPLHQIAGRYLVEHVYERAGECQKLSDVFIATDHPDIQKAAEAFGAKVIMTRKDHPTGTDRLAEAIAQIDSSSSY